MMSKQHYRVKRAYGPWSVGHVFTEMQGNEARTLMARGLIEETQDDGEKAAGRTGHGGKDLLGDRAARKTGRRSA